MVRQNKLNRIKVVVAIFFSLFMRSYANDSIGLYVSNPDYILVTLREAGRNTIEYCISDSVVEVRVYDKLFPTRNTIQKRNVADKWKVASLHSSTVIIKRDTIQEALAGRISELVTQMFVERSKPIINSIKPLTDHLNLSWKSTREIDVTIVRACDRLKTREMFSLKEDKSIFYNGVREQVGEIIQYSNEYRELVILLCVYSDTYHKNYARLKKIKRCYPDLQFVF